MAMGRTDGPRFSSSFGVHEKTALTGFKQFCFDEKAPKRVKVGLQRPLYPFPHLLF
jgi:hypothetical protein